MTPDTSTSTVQNPSLRNDEDEKQDGISTAFQFGNGPEKKSSDISLSGQDGEDEPTEKWVSGFRLAAILGAITLVSFLMLLDTSIISTAIPRITSDFHSLLDIGWYGTSYQLASAALQPLTGKFYSNFSTKWTYFTFFSIFELGSLLCGVATSSKMLIVGRAVAGMGASGIQNGAFTIVAGCVPMNKRPALIGMIMGFSQLGLVVGPLIGGALTQYSTWRWCFYINLPIGGLVALLLLFVHVPEQIKKPSPRVVVRSLHHKLDIAGFALFAPAAIQLLLALEYGGNKYAWNSSTVIGLFCGAGGTFILFVIWEYFRGESAMIPFDLISKRVIWSSCAVFGLLMSLLYCNTYYLPVYFQAVKGVSPVLSGVYLLPSIVSQLLSAILSGVLVERLGYCLPFVVLGSIVNSVAGGLLSTLSPDTGSGKWIGYQILSGFGQGIGLQMPIIVVQNSLPPPTIPVAMALVMFSATFCGSLFLSFSQTILTNSLQTLVPQYAPGVSAETVISAGATGIKSAVPANWLPEVLIAYSKSTDRVFYLSVGAAAGCFIFSWGIGWERILGRSKVSPA